MLAQKASKSLLCSVIPFICGWKVRNLQEALCSSINEEDEEETKVLSSICVNQQQISFMLFIFRWERHRSWYGTLIQL